MITRRILGTIFGAAIFCTLAGGILGWAIGCFWPEYYQIVFGRAAQQAAFDPVAVGVGLGVTQGAVAGLVVGCAAALLVAWVTIRRTPGPRSTPEGDVTTAAATKSPRHRGVAGCLLLSCAAVLVFAVGLAAGLLVDEGAVHVGVAGEDLAEGRHRKPVPAGDHQDLELLGGRGIGRLGGGDGLRAAPHAEESPYDEAGAGTEDDGQSRDQPGQHCSPGCLVLLNALLVLRFFLIRHGLAFLACPKSTAGKCLSHGL